MPQMRQKVLAKAARAVQRSGPDPELAISGVPGSRQNALFTADGDEPGYSILASVGKLPYMPVQNG